MAYSGYNFLYMKLGDLLNRGNLKTARLNAGLLTMDVSRKISTKEEDVVFLWENGDDLPTFKQVEKIATMYQVSVSVMFSAKDIKQREKLPDYRTGDKKKGVDKINKLINLVSNRQSWIESRLKQDGVGRNKLIGLGKSITKPEELADLIVKKLKIDHKKIQSFSDYSGRNKALVYLTSLLEDKYIFVSKTLAEHRIEVEEMRGLFMANAYAPFIVVNRRDAKAAQIFTLMHEVAHLFRNTEGISTADFRTLKKVSKASKENEEVFCNKVAAEILIPRSFVKNMYYYEGDINELARKFKVSSIFTFYRLKSLGRIDGDQSKVIENNLKRESAEGLSEKKLREEGKIKGNYYNNIKGTNGRLFNDLVYNHYFDNNIGYSEATRLLRCSVDRV